MVREKSSEMGNVILESITNVRTIRAYTKEEENYQKMLDGLMANADIVIYDKTLKKDYVNPIEAFFNKFKKRK